MKRSHWLIAPILTVMLAAPIATPFTSNSADALIKTQMVKAATDTSSATTYTSAEKAAIEDFQAQYASLSDSDNDLSVLYQTEPNFSATFAPGVLSPTVINKMVAWINYYRSLSGLPAISASTDSNDLAQISSAVMAYAESDPYKNQHNLQNTTKPINLPTLYWNRAILGTGESNLYFGFPKTVGEPIRELMLDNTNISGMDAGHRAWFLSPFLSTVGVGIAKSQAGRYYESVLVNNSPDRNRTPSSEIVSYPNNGVFPVEELTAANGSTQIPWSISSASSANLVTDDTKITVTNLTDGTTGTTSPIYSGSAAYSKSFMSFLPPNAVTINDHSQYKVTISGLNSDSQPNYSYQFKTFSEAGNGVSGSISDTVNTQEKITTNVN